MTNSAPSPNRPAAPTLQLRWRPMEDAGAAAASYAAHVLSPGGACAVAAADDGTCWRCWPNGERAPLPMRAQHLRTVGGCLIFAGEGSLTVCDAATLQVLQQVATACAFHRMVANAKSAVIETPAAELIRVDLATGQHQVLQWLFAREQSQPLLSFCCDDAGRWLAAVHPNAVRIWDLTCPDPGREPLATIAIAESYGGFAQFLGDRLLVYGAAPGWQVLDLSNGKPVGSWPLGVDPREPLTGGGGQAVIACIHGKALALVEAATGRTVYGFEAGPMENVSLSSDERLLVGWRDNELAVWDVASGTVVGRWREAERIRNARVDGATVVFVDPAGRLIFAEIP